MRDDAHNTPIPERFEPSTYHAEALKKAEARLAKIKATSLDAAALLAREEYNQRTSDQEKEIRERNALKNKYTSMLSKCKAWTPPTGDHAGLKGFMIEQIMASIDGDCDTRGRSAASAPLQSGEEWIEAKTAQALHGIVYHTKEDNSERARADSRSLWVKELRDSLSGGGW